MTLLILVLLAAFVFEYINGFHDTANAIATVVSTKVLTPRQAVLWAAGWNLFGALMGTAVATTISKGIVDSNVVTMGAPCSVPWWARSPGTCLPGGSACHPPPAMR